MLIHEAYEAVDNTILSRRHDDYRLVFGHSDSGRYLIIVLDPEPAGWYIVTARDMTDAEKRAARDAKGGG